jgi:Transport and Golgi organisation 2
VCTLALYFQIVDDFPLLVAANRDERYDRPATPPTVLNTKPKVLAGIDLRAGGTWLGVNEHGVLAAILNRRSEESTDVSTRSRGLLCLDLLARKSAAAAGEFLEIQRETYQPFTVVCADSNVAWFAFNTTGRVQSAKLSPGLHVFSNAALHDEHSEKKHRAYALFAKAQPQKEELCGPPPVWTDAFAKVLSDHALGNGRGDPRDAICVHGDVSGTVSSSIILFSKPARQLRTFYCAGPPCQNSFRETIALNTG